MKGGGWASRDGRASEWSPACFVFSFLWGVMGGTSRTAPLKEENEDKKASHIS